MTFLTTHDSALWRNYVNTLFEMVRTLQQCLRKQNDYLLQHELNLMQRGIHCSKYAAVVTRTLETTQPIPQQTDLPESLFSLIQDLIQRDTVQSVSCPFTDHHVWRLLVGEQVRRAERSGLPLQQAFELNGADGEEALAADIQQWGGQVHIPYEGVCEADIFIQPTWHRLPHVRANASGRIVVKGSGGACQYLLTQKNYGESDGVRRSVIGDWFLYESTVR